MIPAAAAAQHPGRVDGGEQETSDEVGRDDHVRQHEWHRAVEDHADRVDVDASPAEFSVTASGTFIQALAATTEMLP